MAGINAVLGSREQAGIVLGREEAYIGVLIDDLVTKGVDEPYRMFTSRAEYRILLRQDNADERLTMIGHKIGTVDKLRIRRLEEKESKSREIIDYVNEKRISPEDINAFLEERGTNGITQKTKAVNIALRPQVDLMDLLNYIGKEELLFKIGEERIHEIVEAAEIKIKYEGYIKREKLIAEKITRLEQLKIPEDIQYSELMSISTEGRQKLNRIKPESIGHASRISGVSPSDVNILLMYLGR